MNEADITLEQIIKDNINHSSITDEDIRRLAKTVKELSDFMENVLENVLKVINSFCDEIMSMIDFLIPNEELFQKKGIRSYTIFKNYYKQPSHDKKIIPRARSCLGT